MVTKHDQHDHHLQFEMDEDKYSHFVARYDDSDPLQIDLNCDDYKQPQSETNRQAPSIQVPGGAEDDDNERDSAQAAAAQSREQSLQQERQNVEDADCSLPQEETDATVSGVLTFSNKIEEPVQR